MTILDASEPNVDNTYILYDYSLSSNTTEEKRSTDVQFYLQADQLVGYRYSEAILGSKKPLTQTVKFSNEFVPITKEQRSTLGHKLLQARVFDLKSDPIIDAKADFSSLSVRIGKQDQQFLFNTSPTSELRKKIHDILVDFVRELKIDQPVDREKATQISEGDTVPARQVSLAEVLANPVKFNGKRISVVGFFHDEFEGRSLSIDEAASKKRDVSKSVWPGEFSVFANQLVQAKNDCWSRVEGIFVQGPEGHMGMWPGAIDRITLIEEVSAPK